MYSRGTSWDTLLMAENKTQPTAASVEEFIASVENHRRRSDAVVLAEMMERLTGQPPVMWGPSIIGFGSYHYTYESGREGDAAAVGFSPRKASLTLYGLADTPEAAPLREKLGKHKESVACVYINKLEDVDLSVLEQLISLGYRHTLTTTHRSLQSQRNA